MKRMILVLAAAVIVLASCEKKSTTTTPEKSTPAAEVKKVETPKTETTYATTGSSSQAKAPAAAEAAKPAAPTASTGNPVVVLKTTKGTIEIELYPDKAPITVANFLQYVKTGFYNGTVFHRVIPGFMIQGGGMTADMTQKPTQAPIKNEASNGLKNDRGTISMARTNAPNSATSQFFINVKNNVSLNYAGPGRDGYAVFGKVIKGMDVADAIISVPTTVKGGHRDVPSAPIVIESAAIK